MNRFRAQFRSPAFIVGVAACAAAVLLSPAALPAGSGSKETVPPGAADRRAARMNGRPGTLAELVDYVDQSGLERTVRDLSGADTILVDGAPVVLKTRHAILGQKDQAFRYLFERISALGYQPLEQRFVLQTARPDLTACAVSGSLDTVWAGSIQGGVYRAFLADGWERFERCAERDVQINDFSVDPAGRLWAACGLSGSNLGALFVSLDGGVSWSVRKSGSGIYSLRSVAFCDEQFGVACGAAGTVLATADGGGYWFPFTAATFSYRSLNGAASSGPMHFWICADAGYLFETTSLGSPWTEHKLDTFYPLNAIDFADSLRGVVVGTGVAFSTHDGGASWNPTSVVPPPAAQPALGCVAMFDTLRVVAAGGGGMIFLSENGGADWIRVDPCSGTDDVAEVAYCGRDVFFTAGRDEAQRVELAPSEACRHYQFGDTTWGRNIVFRAAGRDEPDRRVVLCAHYDAISGSPAVCAPGADDNGTGTAGVLESARILFGAPLSRTVEFLLFDGEELGCRGSTYFANRLDADAVYESVVNLDMLGYDFKRDFSIKIAGRAVPEDSAIADTVMTAIGALSLRLQPDYTTAPNLTSDHISFQSVGVPAIMLIESERDELNPGYHSCRDIADSVMFDYHAECVRAALGAVALLAGYDFRPGGEAVPFVLYQNRPNPFPRGTLISFTAPDGLPVELAVYDVLGRIVARLDPHRVADADSGWVSWDGTNGAGREIASGVYFVRLSSGGKTAVKKAVLIR